MNKLEEFKTKLYFAAWILYAVSVSVYHEVKDYAKGKA